MTYVVTITREKVRIGEGILIIGDSMKHAAWASAFSRPVVSVILLTVVISQHPVSSDFVFNAF